MKLWLVVLLVVPGAAAQALFDDPEGDHEMGYAPMDSGGEPVQWMEAEGTGWFPYADVLEAGVVEETETDLVFRVKLGAWETGSEPESHREMVVSLPFTFHDETMQADMRYRLESDTGFLGIGPVEEYHFGDTVQRYVRYSHAVPAERVDDSLVASFPKERLTDSQLVPARAGDVLQDMHVLAEGDHWFRASPCFSFQTTQCWRARDVVEGTASLELAKNPPGVGHLLLFAEAPYRASNGAATTYLFNLTLRNIGDIDDRVTIQVGGQPSDWVVRAPTTMELPKGDTKSIPVAVSVPFKHAHGGQETVEVRVASTSQEGIEATQAIGVVWHEIPQPGGHHKQLHIHSDGRHGWMNTLAQDPDAEPEGTIGWSSYSQYNGLMGAELEMTYHIPLSPRLLMGLEFEKDGRVLLDLPFEAGEAFNGTVAATLGVGEDVIVQDERDVDFDAGRTMVTFDLPLQAGVDRIPFDDQNLILQVRLAYEDENGGVTFQGWAEDPVISTDGAGLRLPLLEYHDIIDKDLLASLGRLSLRAADEVERLVNPDKTVAVAFEVSNAGSKKVTVDWSVEGSYADWARVVPAASDVPPKGNATVLVTVRPPADMQEGEAAQLLLVGQDRRDPDVQVFGRLVATVTTSVEIPDESSKADQLAADAKKTEAKKSPALAMPALALALAYLVRRR